MMRRTIEGFEFSDRSIKVVAVVFSLIGGIFTLGVSYGTARIALNGKANAAEVADLRTRFTADSVDRVRRRLDRDNEVVRIEAKLDAMNLRMTQLACYRNPNPACR